MQQIKKRSSKRGSTKTLDLPEETKLKGFDRVAVFLEVLTGHYTVLEGGLNKEKEEIIDQMVEATADQELRWQWQIDSDEMP